MRRFVTFLRRRIPVPRAQNQRFTSFSVNLGQNTRRGGLAAVIIRSADICLSSVRRGKAHYITNFDILPSRIVALLHHPTTFLLDITLISRLMLMFPGLLGVIK